MSPEFDNSNQPKTRLVISDIRTPHDCELVLRRVSKKLGTLQTELDSIPSNAGSDIEKRVIQMKNEALELEKNAAGLEEKVARESAWTTDSRQLLNEIRDRTNQLGRNSKTLLRSPFLNSPD